MTKKPPSEAVVANFETVRKKLPRFLGLRASAWQPSEAKEGEWTEVHLIMFNPGNVNQPCFRMDSRDKIDRVISMLEELRDYVWPEE